MLNKKVFVSLILLLGLVQTTLLAQNATIATGGQASGSGGTVSYTVSQILYTTQSGATGSVAYGVQQPFEIMVISGIEDLKVTLDCKAYPNPTTNFLRLIIDITASLNIDLLTYQIFDANGKQLLNKKVEANETNISMQGLVRGIYYLKVVQIQNNTIQQEIRTFKIIKN